MNGGIKPKILQVTEDSYLDQTGKVKKTVHVKYMVGEHGPFTADVPAEGFTAQAAQLIMDARAQQIAALGA